MGCGGSKSVSVVGIENTENAVAPTREKIQDQNANNGGVSHLKEAIKDPKEIEERTTPKKNDKATIPTINYDLRTKLESPAFYMKGNIESFKFFKVEDTFWEGKLALIPDFGDMAKMDDYARDAPDFLGSTSEEIVKYLTEFFCQCETPLQKARVLFGWIAYNIDYDYEKYEKNLPVDSSVEGVLLNRTTTCHGYSALYRHFCNIAEIECRLISGRSKGGKYVPGHVYQGAKDVTNHSWNMIQLDGSWYLCDVTWASTAMAKTGARRFQESEFLANPRSFVQTRLPMKLTERKILLDEQLLPQPVSDENIWEKSVRKGTAFFALGISDVSHEDGVIDSEKDNTITIKFKSPHQLSYSCSLSKGSEKTKETKLERQGSVSSNGDVVTVKLYLPGSGEYLLQILARPLYGDENTKQSNRLLFYRIRAKGNVIHSETPGVYRQQWGPTHHLTNIGFEAISHKDPEINCKNGNAVIKFGLPDDASPEMNNIWCSLNKSEESAKGGVYLERLPNFVTCNVHLPEPGKFQLSIYTKIYDDYEKSVINRDIANYYLSFGAPKKGEKAPKPFPNINKCYGPDEKFYRLGLRLLEPLNSTIEAVNGIANLSICLPPGIKAHCSLETVNDKLDDSKNCIYTECVEKTVLKFHLKLPEEGYFVLNMFANEEKTEGGAVPFVGRWFLDCHQPYKGEFYPSVHGKWGPLLKFTEFGLDLVDCPSSTLVAEEGSCQLKVRLNGEKNLKFSHALERNDKPYPKTGKYVCATMNPEGDTVTLSALLPETGYFRLSLFGNSMNAPSNKYVGCWLIDAKNTYGGEFYPEHTGLWGTNGLFSDLGLEVVDNLGSLLISRDGKHELKIRKPLNVKVSFRLESNDDKYGADLAGCVYKEERNQLIVFHFLLPFAGYFKFNFFANPITAKNCSWAGNWLIWSQHAYDGDRFPSHINGLEPYFSELGLKLLESDGGTIHSAGGSCALEIKRPPHIKLSCNVEINDQAKNTIAFGKKFNALSCIYFENRMDSHTAILHLRLPLPGFYKLNLFGNREDKNNLNFLGSLLVDSTSSSFEGAMFPPNDGLLWGPNAHFHQMKLQVPDHASSTIAVRREENYTLKITHPLNIKISAHLEKDGDSFDNCLTAGEDTNGRTVIHFLINTEGYYKMNLFAGKNTLDYAGRWLLHVV